MYSSSKFVNTINTTTFYQMQFEQFECNVKDKRKILSNKRNGRKR